MPDANKTKETRRLTDLAARWMDERGFRCVETEVAIKRGWVCDLAGAISPSRTEAQNLKLVKRKPRRSGNREHDRLLMESFEDAYASIPNIVTAGIEVKVNRSDLKRDFKKKWYAPNPVHLLYVVADCWRTCDGLPNHIGLLLETSAGLRCVRPATMSTHEIDTASIVFEISKRRDNFTKHERLREFDRQAREENNDRVNRTRMHNAVGFVAAVLEGKSIEDAMVSYRIRRLTGPLRQKLDDLKCRNSDST